MVKKVLRSSQNRCPLSVTPSTPWKRRKNGTIKQGISDKFQGVPEARARLHANSGELWQTHSTILTRTSLTRGPLNGGVSNGGVSRSGLVLPFLSFLGLSRFSGIFPICSGTVRGFSRFVLFLFLGLLRAPTRNSPERVRDTIWTFPEKSGKHPGLETPRFSFSQLTLTRVPAKVPTFTKVPV